MKPAISIGPAGWSYPDWTGTVYPSRGGAFDPLEYLSRYFDLVEINSTFYRIPSRRTSAGWAERIAGNRKFCFTVKAHQSLTHSKQPLESAMISEFASALSPLLESGRLRFILMQFPWSFRFTRQARDRIRALAGSLHPFPLALEVRHGSWAAREAYEFVAERRMTLCAIDQPQIGNSLTPHTSFAGPNGAYFRFHGRNAKEWFNPETNRDLRYNYLYSGDELKPWARTILNVAESGTGAVVVLNNHFRGQAAANALELKSLVLNRKVAVPSPLLKAIPRLQAIARGDSDLADLSKDTIQGSLFQQQNNQEEDEESSR
jgi:uncharacterized protein YecE (DUF72 family)